MPHNDAVFSINTTFPLYAEKSIFSPFNAVRGNNSSKVEAVVYFTFFVALMDCDK